MELELEVILEITGLDLQVPTERLTDTGVFPTGAPNWKEIGSPWTVEG